MSIYFFFFIFSFRIPNSKTNLNSTIEIPICVEPYRYPSNDMRMVQSNAEMNFNFHLIPLHLKYKTILHTLVNLRFCFSFCVKQQIEDKTEEKKTRQKSTVPNPPGTYCRSPVLPNSTVHFIFKFEICSKSIKKHKTKKIDTENIVF